MPFDLRNAITGKMRRPTSDEWELILSVFTECTGYRIADPILVLQFPTPPQNTPSAVGGLPTVYIRDMRLYNHIIGRPGNRKSDDFGEDFAIEDGRLPTFETEFNKICPPQPPLSKLRVLQVGNVSTMASSASRILNMVEPYKNISQHPHPNELRQMVKVVHAIELAM